MGKVGIKSSDNYQTIKLTLHFSPTSTGQTRKSSQLHQILLPRNNLKEFYCTKDNNYLLHIFKIQSWYLANIKIQDIPVWSKVVHIEKLDFKFLQSNKSLCHTSRMNPKSCFSSWYKSLIELKIWHC